MHWRQLKKQVEAAGGTYTTPEAARDFIGSSAVRVLDKARHYADVYGDVVGAPMARYSQDGFYFTSNGELING